MHIYNILCFEKEGMNHETNRQSIVYTLVFFLNSSMEIERKKKV